MKDAGAGDCEVSRGSPIPRILLSVRPSQGNESGQAHAEPSSLAAEGLQRTSNNIIIKGFLVTGKESFSIEFSKIFIEKNFVPNFPFKIVEQWQS